MAPTPKTGNGLAAEAAKLFDSRSSMRDAMAFATGEPAHKFSKTGRLLIHPPPDPNDPNAPKTYLKQRFRQSGVTLPLEKHAGTVYRLGAKKLSLNIRSSRLMVRTWVREVAELAGWAGVDQLGAGLGWFGLGGLGGMGRWVISLLGPVLRGFNWL